MAYRFNAITGVLDLVRASPATFPGSYRITHGSTIINAGYVLNEDGTYALNEDDSKILIEFGISWALNEDGTYALGEDGKKIILEGGPSYVLNEDGTYALDESGDRILEEGSGEVVPAQATQLSTTSILSPMIWITPFSSNEDTVYIWGSDVSLTNGLPLPVGSYNTYLPIEDISDLYIIGTLGDGVDFYYLYIAEDGVVDDSGNLVRDDSGNVVTG